MEKSTELTCHGIVTTEILRQPEGIPAGRRDRWVSRLVTAVIQDTRTRPTVAREASLRRPGGSLHAGRVHLTETRVVLRLQSTPRRLGIRRYPMRTRATPTQERPGFTLIELLVVIAIIAV
jgi:prepilin-type N-terminal cleavage/methylation domain-containing protein